MRQLCHLRTCSPFLGGCRRVISVALLASLPLSACDDVAAAPHEYPPVLLSEQHAELCRVRVGDGMPAIELPVANGSRTQLSELVGERGTVLVFWSPDRWMARAALSDLAGLIAAKRLPAGVNVVGVAVGQPAAAVKQHVANAKAEFPQLLDEQGEALAKVGTVALPRIYVLDASGKIVWFDIEYSEATRRELRQSLAVLTSDK